MEAIIINNLMPLSVMVIVDLFFLAVICILLFNWNNLTQT